MRKKKKAATTRKKKNTIPDGEGRAEPRKEFRFRSFSIIDFYLFVFLETSYRLPVAVGAYVRGRRLMVMIHTPVTNTHC